jgi:hypothetical protein
MKRDIQRNEYGHATGYDFPGIEEAIAATNALHTEPADHKPAPLSFFSPSQLISYEPDPRDFLVGDCHIMRGAVFVIGGQPGVGKSRAATELAICGATGRSWLGLPVHSRFKTMIIQSENGRYRLKGEYTARGGVAQIDEHILVSEPPPFGMSFGDGRFREALIQIVGTFKPDVVLIDPWNAAAKDDSQKDYRATFDLILDVLPKGEDKPAIGIVAHTRKPKSDEKRTGGSAMMHLLAGSHLLSSVPRSVFIMVPADDRDDTCNQVVWLNPKNNDGEVIDRSAWFRNADGFTQDNEFDWSAFDKPPSARRCMSEESIRDAIKDGTWDRKAAIERLMKSSGLGEKACRNALNPESKFSHLFVIEDDKWIRLAA